MSLPPKPKILYESLVDRGREGGERGRGEREREGGGEDEIEKEGGTVMIRVSV